MLIEQTRKDRIQAMKDGDTVKKNLLSTLIGDCCKNVKEPDDAIVIAMIKKFIKNSVELLDVLINTSNYTSDDTNKIGKEIRILESYLPQQLTEEQLRIIISNYIEYINTNFNNSTSLGEVMKFLKQEHDGKFDGKVASILLKNIYGLK
jgi:uncharacterized protein YqeY